MNCFGLTDIGKRRVSNQDCFRIQYAGDFLIALVCDGMGGANGGAVASEIAADVFCSRLSTLISASSSPVCKLSDYIRDAVNEANSAVFTKASSDQGLSGMGSTLVAFITDGKNHYTVNIGDSRAYYLSPKPDIGANAFIQLTRDHSLVQSLLDSGIITESEAAEHPNRNIIMRAVGVDPSVEADIVQHNNCSPGGMILLCSDGLSGYFHTDNSYLAILEENDYSIEKKAALLVEYANDHGGNDNITAVIALL